MAKIFERDSKIIKDHMYSRLGKAIKFQYRQVINSGVSSRRRQNVSFKFKNTFNLDIKPIVVKVPVQKKRPTSSFACVDRSRSFCGHQSVLLYQLKQ